MAIPLIIGRNENGEQIWHDLTAMPHLLIAGATGNGKSSAMHSIICSIAQYCDPKNIQMVGIDLKKVDHNRYSKLPHMLFPVAIDLETALKHIKFIHDEIERRSDLFTTVDAPNIDSYCRWTGKTLSRIVFFLDELATLDELKEDKKEYEQAMRLLRVESSKARALGVHIIVSTQRPDATIIDTTFRAVFTYTIGFGVKDRIDSDIILKNDLAVGLDVGDCIFQIQKTQGQQADRNFLLRSPYLNVDNHEADEIIKLVVAKYMVAEQTKAEQQQRLRANVQRLLADMFAFSKEKYNGQFATARIYDQFKTVLPKGTVEKLCVSLENDKVLKPGSGNVPRTLIEENLEKFSEDSIQIIINGLRSQDTNQDKKESVTEPNLLPRSQDTN